MNYKVLDMEKYYRKDIYRHFTMDCKCSDYVQNRCDRFGSVFATNRD